MLTIFSRLAAAWPLVGKRSLSHWRLLSSVVIGVFLASAVMAGTVIYFDSLRELALDNTLDRLTRDEKNIVVKANRGPTNRVEYAKVAATINREIEAHVDWLLADRIRGGKSTTFFLTAPGAEAQAGHDNARSYFAFLPRLTEHVTLLPGGRLPSDEPLSLDPFTVEAIIPDDAAELFGVGVGDRLSAVPFWDDVTPYASVVVSGVFERDEPDHQIWHMERAVFDASTGESFRTVPFHLSEQSFMEVLGAAFVNMDSVYSWLLVVDNGRLNADNSSETRGRLAVMARRLSGLLHGYLQITSLDLALAEFDQRLFFSKAPMFVVLVLISVVILYYVVTLSSMLAEERREDIALLRSRGAGAGQVLAVFALEGGTIAVLAVAAAPLLAALTIALLGYTPAFSDLSGGGRLPIVLSGGAFMMSAVGGLLSFGALMVPAVQAMRTGVAQHRQQAARPSAQPFFQRYYLDAALLVVAVLLFRQLEEQGSVVAADVFGQLAVDQVLLAVPALTLVAFAVLMLRLFPLCIRFLSGDSPSLVHLAAASALLVLVPTIAARGLLGVSGGLWPAQVALLAAFGGAYWATFRDERLPIRLAGIAAQAGLVAAVLLLEPTLPLDSVFAPILISIPMAQAAYLLLRAVAQRFPVGIAMAMWQMARNPTHYARLSLLLILMAGLGIVAASFGGTLSRNFEERALYETGAPIRLDGVMLNTSGPTKEMVGEYESLDGIERAAPVLRAPGTVLSSLFGEFYTMVAVDNDTFADIAWSRPDFSERSMADLMSLLEHDRLPVGIELPAGSRSLSIRVTTDRPRPTVAARARLRDSNGRYLSVCLGTLDFSEWHTLEADLVRAHNCQGLPYRLQPIPPLTLVSIAFDELDWRSQLRAGSASIDEIRVRTSAGVQVLEEFNSVDSWQIIAAAPEAMSDILQTTELPDGTRAATFVWTDGRPLTGRGVFHGPPIQPVPVIATEQFIAETGHSVGDEFEVSASGRRIPIRIVDTVSYFPTLDVYNRLFLISDLSAVSAYANLETTSGELRPNEIWLSTGEEGVTRSALVQRLERPEPFPNSTVRDREQALALSQVDPLVDAGWKALLFIAFAAVLILSGVGFLVHAYFSFRTRQGQFALMRTVGFSMRQLITLVWLEQALVIVAGLALGTWMGGRLGETIMPFLAHDDMGGQVLPPFTVEVRWVTLGVIYAAMALLFAVITIGVVWFIRRISLQRILRLGEM